MRADEIGQHGRELRCFLLAPGVPTCVIRFGFTNHLGYGRPYKAPILGKDHVQRQGKALIQSILEEHPYAASPNGDIVRLAVDTGVAASEHGQLDRVSLLALAEESLHHARTERRTRSFNP